MWQQFTAAGLPRDGGMAQLREQINGGRPPFAAVICENIERSGRDMFDALKTGAGAAPGRYPAVRHRRADRHPGPGRLDHAGAPHQAGHRRVLQVQPQGPDVGRAQAVHHRGHNTGLCPYGYAEDRTPHPNPMKQPMGATRARLVTDPERGPWVTRIFEWRVYEQLDCNGIARRLTEPGAPARDGQPWCYGSVYTILRNPKYTGKVVLGRTRNAGESQRPGERKVVKVPREHWTWAADGNEHPALVPMELWEAAQDIGRKRGSVRDHTAPPAGRHLYPLRSRITCAQCQRRMCGLTAPGTSRAYYVCPHNPNNPRHAAASPGHVRAAFRDHVIYNAVDGILGGLLGHDQAAVVAARIPATQAAADARAAEHAGQLAAASTRPKPR